VTRIDHIKAETLSTPAGVGRYEIRFATTPSDLRAAGELRTLAFQTPDFDRDRFDDICDHVLIRHRATGTVVCCFRVLLYRDAADLDRGYCAQFYDLTRLHKFPKPMLELGRFCSHPDWPDPDVLRLAWGALARIVDENGVSFLFGCSSFSGTNVRGYLDTFAMLNDRHLGPEKWMPQAKTSDVFRFPKTEQGRFDLKKAMLAMPPLLRTYLLMGGWVGDHVVVDHHMTTLHVFTGLEIDAIPEARKRFLRPSDGR
jgi:putative hemolysin